MQLRRAGYNGRGVCIHTRRPPFLARRGVEGANLPGPVADIQRAGTSPRVQRRHDAGTNRYANGNAPPLTPRGQVERPQIAAFTGDIHASGRHGGLSTHVGDITNPQ